MWHLFLGLEPAEVLKMRMKQKMYLARYGRQDIYQWEHREVIEIELAMQALTEIVKAENNLGQEDRG